MGKVGNFPAFSKKFFRGKKASRHIPHYHQATPEKEP
jgi:hypothetical protein